MKLSTEELIARHRDWLRRQGLPLKAGNPTAPAPAAAAALPQPAAPLAIVVPRLRPPRPPAAPDHRTPDEQAWDRLCHTQGTPIYDQAMRLLRERALK